MFRPVLAVKLGTLKGAFHESNTLKHEKDKGQGVQFPVQRTLCCLKTAPINTQEVFKAKFPIWKARWSHKCVLSYGENRGSSEV